MAIKSVKIVEGSDITVNVSLTDKSTGLPFSLAGFAGCTGYFLNADNSVLAASGGLVSSDLGKVFFVVSKAETALLAAADDADVEVEVDLSGKISIAQILDKIEVVERLFS
jgi:hypothetical protein